MISSDTIPRLTLVDTDGTHTLALYTHGVEPISAQNSAVLFISGVASSSLNWAAVARQLSLNPLIHSYDRAGYRHSDVTSHPPTAENTAQDPLYLVENVSFTNSLILVGHSWTGVLINEFIGLTRNSNHIAGLGLVDANHESMLQVLNVNNPDL